MHRLILPAVALLLAACAAPPPGPVPGFRKPAVPIYSAAALNLARLEGRWTQAATFSATGSPGCPAGAVTFFPSGGAMQIDGQLCLAGRVVPVRGAITPSGPGRFGVPGLGEWWVVWVDEGYRTLAIGTPSGAWGFVLDEGRLSPDRLEAAREVFDFNGYAAARLRAY